MALQFKRVLLKLSGEAMMGKKSFGFDPEMFNYVAGEIAQAHQAGLEIGVVIGGGNIFRGTMASDLKIDRVAADHMGMLATVINAIALVEALDKRGSPARLLTAQEMRAFGEPYIRRRALRHLEKGRVTVFAGGTGNPYFTTDSAAALRAVEMRAEILLKATSVDGLYDKDPKKSTDARFIKSITFGEVLTKQLKVMDSTAFALCQDNKLPIRIYSLREAGALSRIAHGEDVGSLVTG